MKLKTRIKVLALAAIVLALATPPILAQGNGNGNGNGGGGGGGAAYAIVPFDSPAIESVSSYVGDLNEMGHAVGGVERADGTSQAVHLDLDTGDYTTLSGSGNSGAGDVNNLNQIVGENDLTGLFWPGPSADPLVLPPLPGDVRSWATAINDAGIILGGTADDDFSYPAVVVWRVFPGDQGGWQVDGPLPLGPLPGDTVTWGANVNELYNGTAQVIGWSYGLTDEAVIWSVGLNPDGTLALPGSPVGLGTLGLRNPSNSAGSGINNLGDVSGTSDRQPFIATNGDAPEPLSVPRNTLNANALDINDNGDCVGYVQIRFKGSNVQDGPRYAYLWKNGEAIDLAKEIPRQSGWEYLTWSGSINNAGLIAGFGRFDVQRRGFLLIPK